MKQVITEEHRTDANGNPAGGASAGVGMVIQWQDGPLGRGPERKDPNGAFVEGVIQAAIGRLRFYQGTKFACLENALAISYLEEAMRWCERRTQNREEAGVEGTHGLRPAEGQSWDTR